MLKTPRDQRKCQIYNCLDDESHFFFNCGINKKRYKSNIFKKEAHYNFNNWKKAQMSKSPLNH
jgi:hypothetical protein